MTMIILNMGNEGKSITGWEYEIGSRYILDALFFLQSGHRPASTEALFSYYFVGLVWDMYSNVVYKAFCNKCTSVHSSYYGI